MKLSHVSWHFFLGAFAFLTVTLPIGCGQERAINPEEEIKFENPVAYKKETEAKKNEMANVELGEKESSDFWARPLAYGVVPYGPFPLYDYYNEQLPVAVPLNPFDYAVDYVHPFYAYRLFNPFWDDDDGLYFRPDDD